MDLVNEKNSTSATAVLYEKFRDKVKIKEFNRMIDIGGRDRSGLNRKELFTSSTGVRVVTDLKGSVVKVVGISPKTQSVTVHTGKGRHKLSVKPNQVYGVTDGKCVLLSGAPFDYPYSQ